MPHPADEELRALYDGTPDGILIADSRSGRFLRANPAICRMLGYSEQELLRMSVADIHPADEMPRVQATFAEMREGSTTRVEALRCLRKDASVFYADIAAHPLIYQNRPSLAGFFRDVTRQKQSEAEFRSLFENLPDFVLLIDQDVTIRFANRDGSAIPRASLIGLSGLEFLIPEHRPACQRVVRAAVDSRQVQTIEVCDIYGQWWSARIVPLAEDGQVQRLLVICTDITAQRKHAEAIQKEQQLLRRLLDLHERDRQLMAYEIHDGLTQQITAALFGFRASRQLYAQDPEKAAANFETGLRLLGQSITEARRLISGLRPPILDEFGIVAAIEFLICECRKKGGPDLAFNPEVEFGRLAPPLESAIFRIIQESLNNALRHSQSQQIRIELVQKGDRIHIAVRDWGIGFDPASVREGRFGLQSIRERARLLGGKVVITTAPGQGTEIAVELPVIERVGP